MRKNKEMKSKLIEEIEKIPKEANRMMFVNKINDIHNKLQKTKINLKKGEEDIEKAKRQIVKVKGVLNRSTIAIQNVLNLSTKD
jgi:peptidoglycan hydrolase CwlO-like protein